MNTSKTYLIDYEVFDKDNISIKKGQIKVKNKMTEFEAKASLGNHLEKKVPNFHRLVISKCEDQTLDGLFASIFGDIFK